MNVKKPGTVGVSKLQKPVRKAAASASHAGAYRRPTPTELAKWIKKARKLPAVRRGLVERVKAEIADGAYETPEKLQIAAERLLDELG